MRQGKLLFFSLILLVLLFTSGTVTGNQQINVITIPQQVEVTELQVKLKNIAQIKGSTTFKDKVEDINLGKAPLPDYSKTIYRQRVINGLKKKQVDIAQVKLQVPYQFNIVSNYHEFSVDKMIKVGKSYIYNQLPYSDQDLKLQVVDSPQQLKVPAGEVKFEVEDNFARNLIGKAMIPIKTLVNDELYKRFYLKYKVKLWKDVLVAKEDLKQGQQISRSLFTKKRRLVSNPNQNFVEADKALTNFKLKNSLNVGEVLLQNMVELPALVKRWQDVTIIAQVGGVIINTTGRSLQSGHKGEVIRVKNKTSGETIKGKVVGKKKVKVTIR